MTLKKGAGSGANFGPHSGSANGVRTLHAQTVRALKQFVAAYPAERQTPPPRRLSPVSIVPSNKVGQEVMNNKYM